MTSYLLSSCHSADKESYMTLCDEGCVLNTSFGELMQSVGRQSPERVAGDLCGAPHSGEQSLKLQANPLMYKLVLA
jgi:hypothetical protein